jgi:DNA-binding MarR family transcriptional regulator
MMSFLSGKNWNPSSTSIPEINPAAVMAMLRILQTSTAIRDQIFVQLEQKHQLSEGKLSVMMVLYEHPEGAAPSVLAENAGVSRATISVMLHRLLRDKLVRLNSDREDGRGKLVHLTAAGPPIFGRHPAGTFPAHFPNHGPPEPGRTGAADPAAAETGAG